METSLLLFYFIVGFIVLEYILSRVLSYLNSQTWTKELPDALKDVYSEKEYTKARAYHSANRKFGLFSGILSTLFLLGMLFFGGFAYLDEWVRQYTTQPVLMAILFFGVLMVISEIIGIPFSWYSTFVIEEKFGFNKTTLATFVTDKLKGYVLMAVLGMGMLAILVYLYNWAGSWFWVYAWGVVTAFTLFFATFYTSFIVPIFNKLTPLEEGELRTAIEKYSQKVQFPVTNIFVIDGSKRSTKANAYFSGMGSKKSIVLYDTLIKEQNTEELVAVLAHEVGHYKKKHITKSMIISILNTGLMLFLLGWALSSPALSAALGVEQPSFHIGILAFSLLLSPFSMVTGILMNLYSRKNEFEADHFAKTTFKAAPLKSALKKLSVDNLSNLTPHPAYVFMYYSHPPLLQRLQALGE